MAINETLFTGQVVQEVSHGTEMVVCAKCGDENDLIGVRTDAYFDSHVQFAENKGAYVHRHCLSEQRKKELANG
jgi:hypothetical protein